MKLQRPASAPKTGAPKSKLPEESAAALRDKSIGVWRAFDKSKLAATPTPAPPKEKAFSVSPRTQKIITPILSTNITVDDYDDDFEDYEANSEPSSPGASDFV